MNPAEFIEIIEKGESSQVEFKRKVTSPEKIAKEIAALANTKGGYVFIGVDDDGSIIGVNSEKTEIGIIELACEFYISPPINPKIEIFSLNGSDVVVIYIPESTAKPHTIEIKDENNKIVKRAYIRVGEKSVIASREMYRLMKYQNNSQELRIGIGHHEKRLFAYLEAHHRATVNDFSKIANISRRRAERLMIRLVRMGILQIHNESTYDYFTLTGE